MKDLIILGASGAGREVYEMATQCEGFNRDWKIKGFLDDNIHVLDKYSGYPPVLSEIAGYNIEDNDVFICSIGSVSDKKRVIDTILAKGGEFINLIHPKAIIFQNLKIGIGSMIGPFCLITSDVTIGNFVTVQSSAIIGHDASVGDFVHIGGRAFMGGFSRLEEGVIIHPGAVVLPSVDIGKRAILGAGSVAIRNIPPGKTVFGIPAKNI